VKPLRILWMSNAPAKPLCGARILALLHQPIAQFKELLFAWLERRFQKNGLAPYLKVTSLTGLQRELFYKLDDFPAPTPRGDMQLSLGLTIRVGSFSVDGLLDAQAVGYLPDNVAVVISQADMKSWPHIAASTSTHMNQVKRTFAINKTRQPISIALSDRRQVFNFDVGQSGASQGTNSASAPVIIIDDFAAYNTGDCSLSHEYMIQARRRVVKEGGDVYVWFRQAA